ncbi:Chromosome segregation ATPases [hydrothermal vent metagenome]|uniref:Chromosome segregation ATPases n=1 Tax=hydrothermal vent metagenome TaxID=652676 RepID=A0A3B0UKV8_9ZZZZ
MIIENVMYFVLGFMGAGLLSLMIMPSIWRRAIRLTKKRIEAATPMTMSEFRADKDQLRAEFALSTRRLEMNVETLRSRLADQLGELNNMRSDQTMLKSERDQQLTIVRELEERESTLRRKILALEKEGTDLAQRLRMKDRDYSKTTKELERFRNSKGGMSATKVDEVLNALEKERARAERMEEQVHRLIAQLETQDNKTASAHLAIAELREDMSQKDDALGENKTELIEAEVRMANAESRLSELLEETSTIVELEESKSGQLLAEKLSMEKELEELRELVIGTETAIIKDWDSERIEQSHLRERLNDIASDVSRLVYSVEEELVDPPSQSLFDRVQKFSNQNEANSSNNEDQPAAKNGADNSNDTPNSSRNNSTQSRLSRRMRSLRDIHAN